MIFWGIYLLKVNVALTVFYLIYRYFFKNDTFLGLKRCLLLLAYLIAFLYPLVDLSTWLAGREFISGLFRFYTAAVTTSIHSQGEWMLVTEELVHTEEKTGGAALLPVMAGFLYLAGVAALGIRCMYELAGVIRLSIVSRRIRIHGRRVCLSSRKDESFSFFNLIFLYPDDRFPEENEKILLHEEAHVRQFHSLDVIIAELTAIVCWLNPFVWLMKREMMLNHEFLADRAVLKAGIDKKAYQYCLVGYRSSHKAIANLYNHFSVLLLKKRIMMLNKKRTQRTGQWKYLLLVPVTAALLLAGNVDAAARLSAQAHDDTGVTASDSRQQTPQKKEKESPVYTLVDQMPVFPGDKGDYKVLSKYINDRLKYPEEAVANKTEGRVAVSFIVNEDGSVSDGKVLRSVSPELDQEALRVIGLLPDFTPGKLKGKAVRVLCSISVVFKLPESDSK